MRRVRQVALVVLAVCILAFGSSTEILRPQAEADPGVVFTMGCSGGYQASGPLPPMHDAAGIATSDAIDAHSTTSTVKAQFRTFSSWQTPSATYTALTLNVNGLSAGWQDTPGDGPFGGTACIAYTINNGSTWTQIKCDDHISGSGFPQQTFTITLSPTQNLANLKVGVCAGSIRGGADSVEVADIWLIGTYAGAPAGTGSGNGNAHRRGFIIF